MLIKRGFIFNFQATPRSKVRVRAKVARILKAGGFKYVVAPKFYESVYGSFIDTHGNAAVAEAKRVRLLQALNAAKIGAQLSQNRMRVY